MDYYRIIGRLFLKKDVFEEVVRFRKVTNFLIEWLPFTSGQKTSNFLKDIL